MFYRSVSAAAPQHSLPLIDPAALKRARRWLMLGVIALGVAGTFAGLLANTKSDYFYTALAIHVDLSVLVWFLTMACMFFTLGAQGRGWGMLADASFISFALGTLLLVLSGFTGGAAYMSNYIPVIHHPVFFMALGLMATGALGVAINLMLACAARDSVPVLGVVSAAFILFLAYVCFIWSKATLPPDYHGQIYYEYVFWGGGHVLQFVHTQLLLVAWLWLAGAAGLAVRLSRIEIAAAYIFNCLVVLAAPCIYIAYAPTSDEFRTAFTLLMKYTNGLVPLALAGFILWAFPAAQKGAALPKICLIMSLLLFFTGGFLGYLIEGSNVTVPAHYHGSIVGITLAFMGVAYLLLPAFGFADVSQSNLARFQPILYGGGQLCWMAGMAILGSHGVPRKTPGSADTVGALAAFLKHGGDGLALIGGLLFVFIVLRAAWKQGNREVK